MPRRILLIAIWIGYLAASRSAATAPSALVVAAGLVWLLWAPRAPRQVAAAAALGAAFVWGLLEFPELDRFAVYALPVAVNGGAALAFARTLRAGRTPLIAAKYQDACRHHPELVGYLRRLTWLWAVSLTALALNALVFAVVASPRVWWLVVNALDYGVLLILFVGEYAYRRLHFPHHDHPSFPQFVRTILSWRHGAESPP